MPCYSTLLEVLEVKIGVRIDNINDTILNEFTDFTEKVYRIVRRWARMISRGKGLAGGCYHAADRGRDMWANCGVPILDKTHIPNTDNRGGYK